MAPLESIIFKTLVFIYYMKSNSVFAQYGQNLLDWTTWTADYNPGNVQFNGNSATFPFGFRLGADGTRISTIGQLAGTLCADIVVQQISGVLFAFYVSSGEPKNRQTELWDELDFEFPYPKVEIGEVWTNAYHNGIDLLAATNSPAPVPNNVNARYCITWTVGGNAEWWVDQQMLRRVSLATWTKPLKPYMSMWGVLPSTTDDGVIKFTGASSLMSTQTAKASANNVYLSAVQENVGTYSPTLTPSTKLPTLTPSSPTSIPTSLPTAIPTTAPSLIPTAPSVTPSLFPSFSPTSSLAPSLKPTQFPSHPTERPSNQPSTPTTHPSRPTPHPVIRSAAPSTNAVLSSLNSFTGSQSVVIGVLVGFVVFAFIVAVVARDLLRKRAVLTDSNEKEMHQWISETDEEAAKNKNQGPVSPKRMTLNPLKIRATGELSTESDAFSRTNSAVSSNAFIIRE